MMKRMSEVCTVAYGLQNIKTGKFLDVNGGFRKDPVDMSFALWANEAEAEAGRVSELEVKPRTALRVIKIRTTWITEIEI